MDRESFPGALGPASNVRAFVNHTSHDLWTGGETAMISTVQTARAKRSLLGRSSSVSFSLRLLSGASSNTNSAKPQSRQTRTLGNDHTIGFSRPRSPPPKWSAISPLRVRLLFEEHEGQVILRLINCSTLSHRRRLMRCVQLLGMVALVSGEMRFLATKGWD